MFLDDTSHAWRPLAEFCRPLRFQTPVIPPLSSSDSSGRPNLVSHCEAHRHVERTFESIAGSRLSRRVSHVQLQTEKMHAAVGPGISCH